MKPFKYALCFVLALSASAEAAGFDRLLQQNAAQRWPVASEQTQRQLIERTLEMYFWSKDSFSLSKWPSRWRQIEPHVKAVLSSSEGQLGQDLSLAYALLIQDYQTVKTALATTSGASENPYRHMMAVLLAAEDPERPGVWQMDVPQSLALAQKYPEWALAQLVLAESLLERQLPEAPDHAQIQLAQQAVSKALALQPELDYAHYLQGQIYFFVQSEKASAYFQTHLGALDGVANESVGNFYLWMGETELAAGFYEQARQQDPGNLRLYFNLAQIYRQQAPEKLLEAYFKGLMAHPDVALYQQLQAAYADIPPERVAQSLQQHLRQRSDLQELVRGDLAVLAQHPVQALKHYQEALSLNPSQLLAYLQFMEYAWQSRKISDMARLLDQAQTIGLKHPELQYWSGVLALHQGEVSRAVAILTPLAMHHVRSRYTLALAWYQQGEHHKAQRALLSLLEEDPQNLSVLLTLGDLMAAEARWTEAEKVYQLAQQLSPHDVRVYFGQAQLMGQQQKYAAAADLWSRASLLAPESLEIRNNLGNVYIRLSEFKQARQIFESILQQSPDYAVAYYNLACIEALMLQKERAYRLLEQALSLDQGLKQTAQTDPDLQLIKGEARFQQLVR